MPSPFQVRLMGHYVELWDANHNFSSFRFIVICVRIIQISNMFSQLKDQIWR